MVVPRHYSMVMEASTSLCRHRSARLASSSCSTWVECTPSLTSEAEGECVCVCVCVCVCLCECVCVCAWHALLHESGGARQVHNKQSNTNQDRHPFQRKNELPWVGLKPTTLLSRQSALPTELPCIIHVCVCECGCGSLYMCMCGSVCVCTLVCVHEV